MRNNNLILGLFILSQLTVVLEGKAKFSDRQVATMIPKYFARDHNSPKITRTRVYAENSKKVLHLNIEVTEIVMKIKCSMLYLLWQVCHSMLQGHSINLF